MTQSSEDIAKTLSLAGARPSRRLWWAAAALAVLAMGGWLWFSQTQRASTVSYLTEPVTQGPLVVTVTATGTVQPTTQVEVSSELSGTLASVEVDYNDAVTVGQVLARLDDTKLRAILVNAQASRDAARGRVAQAEASAREAQVNYDSQKELDRRGVSSQRDFAAYAATHQRADAELEIAKANLTLAEANLTLQEADLEKAAIRSPIKGVVLDRAADVGQIVASSLSAPTLFILAEDLSQMELRVDIDEADIGRVAVGNTANFTVDAYSGHNFPAVITQVRYAPETTDGVVTYKAVLSVENTDRLLRPGMTATAAIVVARLEDALQVPNAALRFTPPQVLQDQSSSGGGLIGLIMPRRPAGSGQEGSAATNSIWVLRDGVATEVTVTAGETNGRHTAVLSDDLSPGDAAITDQSEAD